MSTTELHADDICWHLEPMTPEPARDPLTMSDDDLLVESLAEATGYHLVMCEAIHALAAVVDAHDRLEQRYHRVLNERKSNR